MIGKMNSVVIFLITIKLGSVCYLVPLIFQAGMTTTLTLKMYPAVLILSILNGL